MSQRDGNHQRNAWERARSWAYAVTFTCMACQAVSSAFLDDVRELKYAGFTPYQLRAATDKLQRELVLKMDPAGVPAVSGAQGWQQIESEVNRQAGMVSAVYEKWSWRRNLFQYASVAALGSVLVCSFLASRARDRQREREGPVIIGP